MFCGCQFSLYPLNDRFVDIILSAIEAVGKPQDLDIQTDDLSTLVVGRPDRVFQAIAKAYAAACRAGEHVVLNALFSRGCPGDPDEPKCTPIRTEAGEEVLGSWDPLGIPVHAQFSLYPLGQQDYMDLIARTIDLTKREGTFHRSKHFCTRIRGDLAEVFKTVERCFADAAKESVHVVIHLTASKGSPSRVE